MGQKGKGWEGISAAKIAPIAVRRSKYQPPVDRPLPLSPPSTVLLSKVPMIDYAAHVYTEGCVCTNRREGGPSGRASCNKREREE